MLVRKLNNPSLNATYVEISLVVFTTICATTFVLHNDFRVVILQFLQVYMSSSLSVVHCNSFVTCNTTCGLLDVYP